MAEGTPLYLLLDDLAGSTLISGFAYLRWADHIPMIRDRVANAPRRDHARHLLGLPRRRQLACSATAPSRGSARTRPFRGRWPTLVIPSAGTQLDDHPEIAMRRARRIDVWDEGGELGIDAMFRDSCWDPGGAEVVVHEYQMVARADRATGELLAVEATPRVLPYAECPGAAPNASWMAGTDLRAMRTEVLQRLRATDCCTHLNDGLRSLAEVPVLARSLAVEPGRVRGDEPVASGRRTGPSALGVLPRR